MGIDAESCKACPERHRRDTKDAKLGFVIGQGILGFREISYQDGGRRLGNMVAMPGQKRPPGSTANVPNIFLCAFASLRPCSGHAWRDNFLGLRRREYATRLHCLDRSPDSDRVDLQVPESDFSHGFIAGYERDLAAIDARDSSLLAGNGDWERLVWPG